VVGLLETGEGEGTGGVEAGGRGRNWGRLVGVERAAVVFWGAVAVSGGRRVSRERKYGLGESPRGRGGRK
jgi:hypothetical protein